MQFNRQYGFIHEKYTTLLQCTYFGSEDDDEVLRANPPPVEGLQSCGECFQWCHFGLLVHVLNTVIIFEELREGGGEGGGRKGGEGKGEGGEVRVRRGKGREVREVIGEEGKE